MLYIGFLGINLNDSVCDVEDLLSEWTVIDYMLVVLRFDEHEADVFRVISSLLDILIAKVG